MIVTAVYLIPVAFKLVLGRQRESYIVSIDSELNRRNFDLIAEYWRNGFGGKRAQDTGKGFVFTDVNIEEITDFLAGFECHSTFAGQKSNVLSYLERIAPKYQHADVLLISPPEGIGGNGPFRLRSQERAVGKGQPVGTSWHLNKDRVASRGDERLGLPAKARAV